MHVDRRTALVTGSTDGHGRLVAVGLAERGWRVLFHGRDADRGRQALAEAGDGGTGRFFDGTREARAIPAAYDPDERERIHQLTAGVLL